MKQRAILLIVLSVFTSLTFLQACSRAGASSTSSTTSKTDFVMETRLDVDELEVRPDMISNRLKIKKMNLDAGQLTFRLFTPAGDVQWEKTFTAPADFEQPFDLEATPGIWKLEIETEDATGNYNIQWKASN